MEKVSRTFKVRAFGITKEILGSKEKVIQFDGQTVADLRRILVESYPELQSLRSLMVAINNVYAEDSQFLQEGDEIALIPPVSGG
jgi:sulfur-carrier protein